MSRISGANRDFESFIGPPSLPVGGIAAVILKQVAYVFACEESDVQAQLKAGDLKISHKEAMSVCTRVEAALKCGRFLHPADFSKNPDFRRERKPDKCLSPAEDCTFAKVVEIIETKLASAIAFDSSRKSKVASKAVGGK